MGILTRHSRLSGPLTLLLIASLAGCGGPAVTPKNNADLAHLIDCHSYHVNHDKLAGPINRSLGLVTDGGCSLDKGGDVQVRWYRDHDGVQGAIQLGRMTSQQFGSSSTCLAGDTWLVCGSNQAAQAAQAKVGGDIEQLGLG